MSVPVLLVTIVILWGGCILSVAWLAWMELPEDPGHVTPGRTRQLRGIEGGKRP